MKLPDPSEKEVQRDIMAFLALHKIFHWRVNSGAITGEYKGKRRFVRFTSLNGVSDIVGILPGGKMLCIECKRRTGKVSDDQADFLFRAGSIGALAFVARSVADVENALRREGVIE